MNFKKIVSNFSWFLFCRAMKTKSKNKRLIKLYFFIFGVIRRLDIIILCGMFNKHSSTETRNKNGELICCECGKILINKRGFNE
jgi:hypothetical protein